MSLVAVSAQLVAAADETRPSEEVAAVNAAKASAAAKSILTPLPPIRPVFPPLAARAGIEGLVVVRVHVDPEGKPYKTSIVQRSPRFVDVFDDAARLAVMAARFEPYPADGGVAVSRSVDVPINFKLTPTEGGKSAVCRTNANAYFPESAKALGVEAQIGILAKVSATGAISKDTVVITGRIPPNMYMFDDAAKAAARAASCEPARRDHVPVDGYVILEVGFTLPMPGGKPSP